MKTILFLALLNIPLPAIPQQVTTPSDSEVLAACMSGRTISLGDGTVLDCRVHKTRRVRT